MSSALRTNTKWWLRPGIIIIGLALLEFLDDDTPESFMSHLLVKILADVLGILSLLLYLLSHTIEGAFKEQSISHPVPLSYFSCLGKN